MAEKDASKKLSSTILWRIENITHWDSYNHGNVIHSPEFRLNNLRMFGWTLSLFPEGEYLSESDPYICLRPFDYVDIAALNCEWSLLDKNDSPILTKNVKHEDINIDSCLEMPDCPTKKDMFVTKRSLFLPNDTMTIQLRLYQTDEDFVQAEHVCLVTRFEALKESFVWSIERFKTLQIDDEPVTSVKLGEEVFKLFFFFTGASLSEADVNFRIVAENVCRQFLSLRVSMSGKDGKEVKNVEGKRCFDASILEQTLVLPKFMSRREILENRPDGLCCDDLTLFCQFTSLPFFPRNYVESTYCGPENNHKYDKPRSDRGLAKNDDTISTNQDPKVIVSKGRVQQTPQSCSQEKCVSLASLGGDLLSFYKEENLSDFELRSGDVTFPVHKIVLSARSPVFRAKFCGDAMEPNFNSMDIQDMDVHTLNLMLNYLYSGTVEELEWENAAKLYYAADKYQISSLKQVCLSVLRSNIVVSNVSDILELADKHKDQDLRSYVHDFIQEHLDEVISSDEWYKFWERSCVAGKTMKEIYRKRRNMKPK